MKEKHEYEKSPNLSLNGSLGTTGENSPHHDFLKQQGFSVHPLCVTCSMLCQRNKLTAFKSCWLTWGGIYDYLVFNMPATKFLKGIA